MTSPGRTRLRAGLLPREEQSAWKIAELAADPTAVPVETKTMVVNRIIDNAAVSAASARRPSVTVARAQARVHRSTPGAAIFGIEDTYSPEWAAFANAVAAHEIELHDVYPAADDTHPGANIPALVAVAQHAGLGGTDLINGIATAYEVQIALARGIRPNHSLIDPVGLLGPSVAAGLGTALRLSPETIYAAISHAVHLTGVGRRCHPSPNSRRTGYAAAYAGKVAIEAMDRAMHGERHPTPPEEANDCGYDWLSTEYGHPVRLPKSGDPKIAILDSSPRAHSAAYSGQAWIDLALRMRNRISRLDAVESIVLHTGHDDQSGVVSGTSRPRTLGPPVSREALGSSVVYMFVVALQDGVWHHEHSYAPERSHRPDTVELWQQISVAEDVTEMGLGARATIITKSGGVFVDELTVPDAHPSGARPFQRRDYIAKFTELAEGIIDRREQQRFLDVVTCLSDLKRGTLNMLNPLLSRDFLDSAPITHGIFR